MTLSQLLRDKFAPFVPEGYDVADLRIATSLAQVQVVDELDPAAQAAMDVAKEAGPPLVNSHGKPTVLKIVSWIGHADVPNKNRDAFVKEELHGIAGSLFRAPNFGVMDFNHSAARPWSDEPKVIGIWYKAEWAFDAKANAGKGAWGLLATGIAFSWLFPDIADKLLADQQRTGTIKVSWTWIPGSTEMGSDEEGSFSINHNPVFFTVSVLDVKPADPDAQGKGSEDPSVLEDDLKAQVATAERIASVTKDGVRSGCWWSPMAVADTGGPMDEKLLKQLKDEKSAAEAKVIELTTRYTQHENDLSAKIVELTAARDEARAASAAASTVKGELEIKVVELTTARDAAVADLVKVKSEMDAKLSDVTTARDYIKGELDKVLARIPELEAEIVTYKAQQAEVEAAKADVAKKSADNAKRTKLVSRLASLPEQFRALHAIKAEDVRARVEQKWSDMSDEQWDTYKNDELLGYMTTKVGYALRSASEGILPAGAAEDDDIKARVKKLLKN